MSTLSQSPGLFQSLLGVCHVGNTTHGRYRHMSDLLQLESTASGLGPAVFLPASPLIPSAWKQALSGHPDRVFADNILWGITVGFHIGADRSVLSLQKGTGNMPSTRQLPHLVREHIYEEMAAGHVLGPLPCTFASPLPLQPHKPHPQAPPARQVEAYCGPLVPSWPK